uniref:NADH-ubiquinone oxidoreductase chain 6 n=1 Tax=Cryptocercus weixiensis TaxID=1980974 RepID=A0A8K1KUW0_9NEOP|nr:NADH dehydrogenase subunit 6 [Hemipenthes hebeiensis]YP_010227836.1 NADH dehydrogenase subunit 6 [Cryptocercus weixiensis]QVJ97674.1 NADH dehydrogenase subunit 6 [Hemipenthes hebeiensis]UDD86622.1 NADH dehydrogenase subunit 6 [Cryptocercus weixiensis]
MNQMMMSMSMTLSMMFTQMNHPLAMGMMLLMQTVLVCLMSGMMSQSFWFSYIMFLIFIGGMLVLFIYVTSLASNEMLTLSTKMMMMSTMMMMLLLFMMSSNWMKINNSETTTNELLNLNNENQTQLNKLYNKPNGKLTIMLASYLFLALITVVKITNITKGPLRQMN